jgi:hypothetical protein
MLGLGTDLALLPAMMVALIAAYWAQLGFMTLLGLLFKRGTLWGIVYLFLQLFLSQILPGNLQRLTINHYVECITGTRATEVRTSDLLAQAPVITPVWVCLLVLFLFGLACWAACGWKLHRTPVGLAGAEAEG